MIEFEISQCSSGIVRIPLEFNVICPLAMSGGNSLRSSETASAPNDDSSSTRFKPRDVRKAVITVSLNRLSKLSCSITLKFSPRHAIYRFRSEGL